MALHRRFGNIWVFLTLFSLCYLLETINFTLLVGVIQSIEKVFKIPSRMSGALVSASDIGYILTVVVLAYLGSKGNRARWIGCGCALIAFACLLIALPHFIFHDDSVTSLNMTHRMRYISQEDMSLYMTKFKKPDGKGDLLGGAPAPNSSSDSGGGADFGNLDAEVEKATLAPWILEWMKEEAEAEAKRANASTTTTTRRTTTPPRTTTEEERRGPAPKYDAAWLLRGPNVEKMTRAASLPVFICNPLVQRLRTGLEEDKCATRRPNTVALAIIFIGIMFIGVGHSMPWTLGMPMIDDHVAKKNTALYFGGVFFIRIIGPVLGFLLGGICNQIYFTFSEPPPGITPLDPSFIGAWWLGYIVIFATLIIPSILLICFPTKHLKKFSKAGVPDAEWEEADLPAVENRANEEKFSGKEGKAINGAKFSPHPKVVVHNADQNDLSCLGKFGREVKTFGKSIWVVLGCKIYTAALIARLFDAFAFKGFFSFLPKYLEVHYGMAKSHAAFVLAGTGIVGFALGIVVGSGVTRRYKLQGRKAAGFIMAASLVSAIVAFSHMGLGCSTIYGAAGKEAQEKNLTTACNKDCFCENATAYPVCSKTGKLYYSPCHAGCKNVTMLDKIKFKMRPFECMCIDEGEEVSRDWCKTDCDTMIIIYFLLSVIGGFVSGMSVIPGVLVMMRSVPVDLRSVALGFSAFAVSLLSTFPSPIVYGHIVDGACWKWSNDCGQQGNCELYDPQKLRYRMHGFMGALRLTSALFDILVVYYAKGLKLFEEHPGGEAIIRSHHASMSQEKSPYGQTDPPKPVSYHRVPADDKPV